MEDAAAGAGSQTTSRKAGHQKLFLTFAFGGIPEYPGQALRQAHRRLVTEMGLSDEHFDAVIENRGSSLQELGVSEDLIAEAAGIAESTRNDVLNR
jgi:hemoglobin